MPEGHWDAFRTEGGDEHHDVVWGPGEEERQKNGAESLSSLFLLDQDHSFPLGHLDLQIWIFWFS